MKISIPIFTILALMTAAIAAPIPEPTKMTAEGARQVQARIDAGFKVANGPIRLGSSTSGSPSQAKDVRSRAASAWDRVRSSLGFSDKHTVKSSRYSSGGNSQGDSRKGRGSNKEDSMAGRIARNSGSYSRILGKNAVQNAKDTLGMGSMARWHSEHADRTLKHIKDELKASKSQHLSLAQEKKLLREVKKERYMVEKEQERAAYLERKVEGRNKSLGRKLGEAVGRTMRKAMGEAKERKKVEKELRQLED